MRRYISIVTGLSLAALAAACTSTPPDRRGADVKAVKAVEAAWVEDAATKDVDKFVSYYTDDAVLLVPNAPAANGKDDIKAALAPVMADPNFALTFQSTRAEASKGDDFVYTVGTYSLTTTSAKDKKPLTEKGTYLSVFKKQADGSWKAVADMVSSNQPVRTEPPQHKAGRTVRTHKRRHSH